MQEKRRAVMGGLLGVLVGASGMLGNLGRDDEAAAERVLAPNAPRMMLPRPLTRQELRQRPGGKNNSHRPAARRARKPSVSHPASHHNARWAKRQRNQAARRQREWLDIALSEHRITAISRSIAKVLQS